MTLNTAFNSYSIPKALLCASALFPTGTSTNQGALVHVREKDGICPAKPVYAEIDPVSECMRRCALSCVFDDAQVGVAAINDTDQNSNILLDEVSTGQKKSVESNNEKKAEESVLSLSEELFIVYLFTVSVLLTRGTFEVTEKFTGSRALAFGLGNLVFFFSLDMLAKLTGAENFGK